MLLHDSLWSNRVAQLGLLSNMPCRCVPDAWQFANSERSRAIEEQLEPLVSARNFPVHVPDLEPASGGLKPEARLAFFRVLVRTPFTLLSPLMSLWVFVYGVKIYFVIFWTDPADDFIFHRCISTCATLTRLITTRWLRSTSCPPGRPRRRTHDPLLFNWLNIVSDLCSRILLVSGLLKLNFKLSCCRIVYAYKLKSFCLNYYSTFKYLLILVLLDSDTVLNIQYPLLLFKLLFVFDYELNVLNS